MSQSSLPSAKQEENQSPGGGSRKTAATSSTRPQEQQALKCPRCDSANTKFCYYNNYSLTQPRHFCKSCRRYWTKGGALRNVPIGGGCRKNKKIKSSSRLSAGDSKDSSGSSEMGGFNFFRGLSPAMDFDLGGLSFPRINPSTGGLYNQFSSFGGVTAATSPATASVNSPYCFSLDPSGSSAGSMMGFSYPISSVTSGFSGAIQELGGAAAASMNVHSSLASSIESLSSINQDLHLKLQQQRLAMLFGEEHQKESAAVSSVPLGIQAQKPQPILFQNLEISSRTEAAPPGVGNTRKAGASGGDTATAAATEWFFGNSYGEVTATPTPTNSSSNGNNDHNAGNWAGVQAWGDLHHHQYNSLP